MANYLLDTNHLSLATRKDSSVRGRIREAHLAGSRIGTCVPVLCELEAGIQGLPEPDRYRQSLRRLLTQVRVWPIDHQVAMYYGGVFQDLRRRGRVLSQVDMMQAALAQSMGLILLTSDRDFEALPSVRVENWLA